MMIDHTFTIVPPPGVIPSSWPYRYDMRCSALSDIRELRDMFQWLANAATEVLEKYEQFELENNPKVREFLGR
jgi:hypothetical protein